MPQPSSKIVTLRRPKSRVSDAYWCRCILPYPGHQYNPAVLWAAEDNFPGIIPIFLSSRRGEWASWRPACDEKKGFLATAGGSVRIGQTDGEGSENAEGCRGWQSHAGFLHRPWLAD